MKKFNKLLLLLFAITTLPGCNHHEAETIEIIDCTNTKVEIKKTINRIVSVDQSCTAFLTALGQKEKLVGVHRSMTIDKWTPYFLGDVVNNLKTYGYKPSAEAMIEIGADVVFLSDKTYAEELRKSGVPALCFNYNNINELFFAVDMLGNVFGYDAKNFLNEWKNDVTATIALINNELKDLNPKSKKNVYYINASNNPSDLYSTFGGDSFVEYWINNVGASLVTSQYKGITSIEKEVILKKNPGTIVIGGYAEYTRKEELLSDPLWSDIEAVKNNDIHLLPTSFASYEKFSIELPLLFSYTANAFYPDEHLFGGINELRPFYKKYYHVDLDDTLLTNLLRGLYPDGTREDA